MLTDIVNKTGLEGRYKIAFRFSTSLSADNRTGQIRLSMLPFNNSAFDLRNTKGLLEVPILDHIEAPSSN